MNKFKVVATGNIEFEFESEFDLSEIVDALGDGISYLVSFDKIVSVDKVVYIEQIGTESIQ